ncbi:MAG: methionyl-tRNA formyltransferase [Gammaproteobacteria bacterium]|jgi:methionyl-tRNA formyltransferase
MMKIIYAGTPDFAVPALQLLMQSEHEVIAVYTQPDRPAGRGRKLQQSDVKQCALSYDLAVYQPTSFKASADLEQFVKLEADLMIVAAYGLILPASILNAPRLGCINIHGSILPRWRGAAPIQRAILADDASTGVTIMQMDSGLDTGGMISKQTLPISPSWNSFDLHEQLKQLGADLLIDTLPIIELGETQPEAQNESFANYASKLTKAEAKIDWHKSAEQIVREIKAFIPWPVSYTHLDGKLLKIWQASLDTKHTGGHLGYVLDHNHDGVYISCGEGVLCVEALQFEGKKRCTAAQAFNGRNLTGSQLL